MFRHLSCHTGRVERGAKFEKLLCSVRIEAMIFVIVFFIFDVFN